MAQAIIAGYLSQSTEMIGKLVATNRNPAKRQKLQVNHPGLALVDTNSQLTQQVSVIVIGVKPKDIVGVCQEIAPQVNDEHLIISLAAGVTLQKIADCFETSPAIVRAMPNTPATMGQGMTGLYATETTTQTQRQLAEQLFLQVGEILWLSSEQDMHAVTAISGSGPAYVFYFAECLIKAGIEQGLSAAAAKQLAIKTLQGAGDLLQNATCEPSVLREQVTSPGGTTEAALKLLHEKQFVTIISEAVAKGCERSKTLGS